MRLVYSNERKEALLRKMLPPHNRPLAALAAEEGSSEATLYHWRRDARDRAGCCSVIGSGGDLPSAAQCPVSAIGRLLPNAALPVRVRLLALC